MLNEPHDGPSYMTTVPKQLEEWIHPYEEYLRRKARELHQLKWIYGLYGALDGLSTSFSTFKYFFDAYYANSSISSSDALHDWVLTPEGLICEIIASTSLTVFACMANLYADNKSVPVQFMGVDYFTLRATIKGYKNTYKGLYNALNLLSLCFPTQDYKHINLLPTAIILGTLAAINRVWLGRIRDERKAWKKQNEQFVEKIEARLKRNILEENGLLEPILEKPQAQSHSQFFWESQSQWFEPFALLAAAFSGVVDAPYLYFGVLSVALLAPGSWLFMIVATCSVIFAVTCIATRLYEEHNSQRELRVTQLQVELAINKHSLLELFNSLKVAVEIFHKQENTDQNSAGTNLLKMAEKLVNMYKETNQSYRDLQYQSTLSWGSIILGGLKNGVDAYGAVASMLFATATVATLLCLTYAPVLLVSFVVTGMACLVFFLGTALLQYQSYLIEKAKKEVSLLNAPNVQDSQFVFFENLKKFINEESPLNLDLQSINEHKKTILDEMIMDSSPQFFFQEWFEVVRLWYSGGSKGIRAVDSLLVGMQEVRDDGHYHDTPAMMIFAYFDAALFALVFALRGFARLGRDKPNESKESKAAQPSTPPSPTVSSDLANSPGDETPPGCAASPRNKSSFFLPSMIQRAFSAPELGMRTTFF